jgi:hypothetical protein
MWNWRAQGALEAVKGGLVGMNHSLRMKTAARMKRAARKRASQKRELMGRFIIVGSRKAAVWEYHSR